MSDTGADARTVRAEPSLRHDVEPTPERLAEASEVFGLLSDRTRLHLLWVLARQDADVSTLADTVDASRTSVSQHLAKLRLAGLVEAHREGRRVRYTLVGGHLRRLLLEAIGHADHVVTGEPHHR
ncbi:MULTISPECIES: helix-turn-helix transcriptional regulator [unclassified Aeromicrobium]|uniref:ArsR/SmtB family transcription factor n=1 Tax=unclassified Aeromicrobium TaxID=2633570 RepID=UPI0006FF5C0B|nr:MULTISPECIES: metalloregulator ArsR/SmtB family transcription factor [unclassified Aeromicrobium]KQP27590.1 ArsR family transcriptional regulator [Aeromicrobium sp. Leaf272]KQP78682.1 ArsR family transcriptional regulator [Aeromicrobium sp. Leaf289]KQP84391.1 ArsR family transcriptional regulator [Aeromicrobium sp. Leaf291]